MDRAYYKKYYKHERSHWWFIVRSGIIKDHVNKLAEGKNNLKIFNIGVATGQSTEMLSQFGEVTSLEYDEDCCRFLREELKMDVIQGSIENLPFKDAQFDMVFALDVIEHVDHDDKAVTEMYRVCKDNGIIFVTVPAFMELWSKHDEINHHKRRYRQPQLRALFKNIEGNIIHSTYFNSLLFIPVYVIRMILNRIRSRKDEANEQGESDFEVMNYPFINKLAYSIFSLERLLLKVFRFPFGISILLSFKKANYSTENHMDHSANTQNVHKPE